MKALPEGFGDFTPIPNQESQPYSVEQPQAKIEVKKLRITAEETKGNPSEVRRLKTNLQVKRGRKGLPVGKKKLNNCVVIPKSLLQFQDRDSFQHCRSSLILHGSDSFKNDSTPGAKQKVEVVRQPNIPSQFNIHQ